MVVNMSSPKPMGPIERELIGLLSTTVALVATFVVLLKGTWRAIHGAN